MKPTVDLKRWIAGALLFCIQDAFAQDSTSKGNMLNISGYAEAYYLYDFNRPVNNTRPAFVYSHNRSNEATINIGFIKAAFANENLRANFALGAGIYFNANLSAEPGVLKNIFEANAGIKLSRTADVWIDAGILPSHIGFESAVGKDNRTLTRSLLADNSPYYEAGVKLSYATANTKWYLAAMYLNGWQRIQRPDGNSSPAFGAQITYKPSATITVNYSNFIGNDKPDSTRQMRYFNNFYTIVQLTDKWGITAGFDIGSEQVRKGSTSMNTWYSPVLILNYSPGSKNNIGLRGEYYSDKKGVIISTATTNGFKTFGASVNYDRFINRNALWRVEVRTMKSKDPVFVKRNQALTRNSTFVSTALTVSF